MAAGDELGDDDNERGAGGDGDDERQHGEDRQIGGPPLRRATLLDGLRGHAHGRGQGRHRHGGYARAAGRLGQRRDDRAADGVGVAVAGIGQRPLDDFDR